MKQRIDADHIVISVEVIIIAIWLVIVSLHNNLPGVRCPSMLFECNFPQDYRRVIVPTKPEPQKSRGSDLDLLCDFEVTWYNNDGITYTTASGGQTIAGRTVGVDPRIIPLGTWIEIHMPDGSILKRRAEDTGGAVKGRILDVYANRSNAELLKRGRTKGATVRILGGS